MEVDGKKLVIRCEFPNCYESAARDRPGGNGRRRLRPAPRYAIMVRGFTGPTLWIKVAYLRPTPINVPLRFEAVVAFGRGQEVLGQGLLLPGDEKTTEAEGLILGSYELPVKGGNDE